METIDDVLQHYGIKGMKWGVRKRRTSGGVSAPSEPENVKVYSKTGQGIVGTSGGAGHSPSDDAMRARAHRQKARASTIHALSNKELQEFITRVDLESKFKKASVETKHMSKGEKWIRDAIEKNAKARVEEGVAAGSQKLMKELQKALK